ncbi:MAG: GAF domain-containing protein [Chitinophagaceae bacterium]
MIVAKHARDEELRLADLLSYDILDSAPEDDFNELVELAAHLCNSPITYISLIDKNRQWFKAKKGIDFTDTPKDISFCTHAILADEIMEVNDTKEDERFLNNPFVTGNLNIRFYAGAPIVSPAGHKLGTVCIMDTQPRKLSKGEQRSLTLLSNHVTKLLELRKKNLQIRERAEELIAIKNKVIDTVIQQKEDDKKQIVKKLHEDLAQSLASGIMYLSMVKEKSLDELPFIREAKKQFSEVLTGICDLSYDIIPVCVPWISAEELLKGFINKIAPSFPFSLRFVSVNKRGKCGGNTAIIAIRIIEQWLKVLAKKKEILVVNVLAHTEDDFEIVIENDGLVESAEELRREVFESAAYDLAHSAGGTICLSVSDESKNMFRLNLPATPIEEI